MTDKELNLVQLKELKRQLDEEDRFIGARICQNAIDYISNQVDKPVMQKIAGVRHPIDAEGKLNLMVTYCCICGANVRAQKYCSSCGSKLDWESLRENSKLSD